MKIFAFILSLYIIALSIVPCSDGMPKRYTDIEISNEQDDHDHSDHKDECTPFCVCFCCGSLITMPYIQTLIVDKVVITTEYHFFFHYTFDYSKGLWQPPAFS